MAVARKQNGNVPVVQLRRRSTALEMILQSWVVTIGALVDPPKRCISCAACDHRLEVVATCMAMLGSFAMN